MLIAILFNIYLVFYGTFLTLPVNSFFMNFPNVYSPVLISLLITGYTRQTNILLTTFKQFIT